MNGNAKNGGAAALPSLRCAFLSGDKLSIRGILASWHPGWLHHRSSISQLLCIDDDETDRDARYENPFVHSFSPSLSLSHLVMPNPNEIISLSPARSDSI